jgi:hypothetical protein
MNNIVEEEVLPKEGCYSCKHADIKHDWVDGKFTVVSQTCKHGNTSLLIKWWEDNGTKKSGSELDKMDCHEFTDSTKCLVRMNMTASKILEDLKNINNENQ